ncbi:MAG: hypothetical protein WAW61_19710 [Methylococcaceae bacterium]
MKILKALLVVLLLTTSAFVDAQTWQEMYDPATLEQSRADYERTTRNIVTRLIEPILSTKEKRRLAGKLEIRFPLYSDRKSPTPLDFYAPNTHVAAPIFSLKFLDDLCTAYAWLQVNGYSIETVSEYTAPLLKRRGHISPPLKALQIPADALNDPLVNDQAQKHFVTARTFILLHELGHLYWGHQGSSISNEQKADEFAARLMADIPLQPLGMLVFFLVDAHWAYAETTHPLSGARVRALADHIKDPELAQAFRDLGTCTNQTNDTCIDDPDIRDGFAITAEAQNEFGLAPRRSGELPSHELSSKSGTHGTQSIFEGRFVGESGLIGGSKYQTQVDFQRHGNKVKGDYSFGIGIGWITGEVTGNTLAYQWTWAGNSGFGTLVTSDDGETFSGKWGYINSKEVVGEWTGRRVR